MAKFLCRRCNCLQCCCVSRLEVTMCKEDEVSGGPPTFPIGTFAWDIATQPSNSVSTETMPNGDSLQVCKRTYLAPISETICSGTARQQDINGRFQTLDRIFPSVSGRYGGADTFDFTGSTGIRCNVMVYGLNVSVSRANGWFRIEMGSLGIEETFGYVLAGASTLLYNPSTCVPFGATFIAGEPPETLYCAMTTGASCPGFNTGPVAGGGYRVGVTGMPLAFLDTGWVASETCPSGEHASDLYAVFEYFGNDPSNDACRLAFTKEWELAVGSTCSVGNAFETRRPLSDSFRMMRSMVKVFLC
jgi:hypothetical protein